MHTKPDSYSIEQLNGLEQEAFTGLLGPLFEHSPWIAERTWQKRPFADYTALHRALCQTVLDSEPQAQLALIRAHPELVGRAAQAGTLTAASKSEQADAGLNALSPQEIALFTQRNRQYHQSFGFPFVLCARLNHKAAILAALEQRLTHSPQQELETALAEIFKIAWLRLAEVGKTGGLE